MPASDSGGPLEGFGTSVAVVEEAVDVGLRINDGAENAVLQSELAQDGEEPFNGIEPRSRGRGEAERLARTTRQPSADLEMHSLFSVPIKTPRTLHQAKWPRRGQTRQSLYLWRASGLDIPYDSAHFDR